MWFWRRDRIQAGEQLIPCPRCSSSLPTASVILLRSHVLRGGRLVSDVTGERVSCQSCGLIYSIGPHGTFRHHDCALPLSPSPVPMPGKTREDAQEPPGVERPLPPRPRERPPV